MHRTLPCLENARNAFVFQMFNKLKKNYESEKRATRYMESLERLWIKLCEILKKELNQTLVTIECPKKRNIAEALPSTKESRTADKKKESKHRSASACRKKKWHE